MKITRSIPLILCLVFPTAAYAIAAMRSEDLLCNSSYIVTAKVVKAYAPDCTERDSFCSETPVPLEIEVKEILGTYNGNSRFLPTEALALGDTLEVTAPIYNTVGMKPKNYGHIEVIPPTGLPLSDEEVLRVFFGKEFIFAVNMTKPDKLGKPHSSYVWETANRAWIRDILSFNKGRICPKPNE